MTRRKDPYQRQCEDGWSGMDDSGSGHRAIRVVRGAVCALNAEAPAPCAVGSCGCSLLEEEGKMAAQQLLLWSEWRWFPNGVFVQLLDSVVARPSLKYEALLEEKAWLKDLQGDAFRLFYAFTISSPPAMNKSAALQRPIIHSSRLKRFKRCVFFFWCVCVLDRDVCMRYFVQGLL